MRRWLFGLSGLAALAFAGASHATPGTLTLSWDNCSPVVVDKSTTTPGVYKIFVSEQGNDRLHRAYGVQLIYGNAGGTVPDAWRFDSLGCAGAARITLDVDAPGPVAASCPSFSQDGDTATLKSIDFSSVFDPYPTGTLRVLMAAIYPAVKAEPGTRYFLGSVTFDLSAAVPGPGDGSSACGGFEQAICFKLSSGNFIDVNNYDVELPFDRASTPLLVTFNGPGGCSGVPARPTTWGAIKSQYRH